jgi:O-methyltransferase
MFDYPKSLASCPENKEIVGDAYAVIRKQRPWAHEKTSTIIHQRILPYATYSPWLSDEKF